jgi:hypothetical protein
MKTHDWKAPFATPEQIAGTKFESVYDIATARNDELTGYIHKPVQVHATNGSRSILFEASATRYNLIVIPSPDGNLLVMDGEGRWIHPIRRHHTFSLDQLENAVADLMGNPKVSYLDAVHIMNAVYFLLTSTIWAITFKNVDFQLDDDGHPYSTVEVQKYCLAGTHEDVYEDMLSVCEDGGQGYEYEEVPLEW